MKTRYVNRVATFHWKSKAGQTYRVEKTESLGHPDWQSAGNPVLATGATTSWSGVAVATNGQYFFRVTEFR